MRRDSGGSGHGKRPEVLRLGRWSAHGQTQSARRLEAPGEGGLFLGDSPDGVKRTRAAGAHSCAPCFAVAGISLPVPLNTFAAQSLKFPVQLSREFQRKALSNLRFRSRAETCCDQNCENSLIFSLLAGYLMRRGVRTRLPPLVSAPKLSFAAPFSSKSNRFSDRLRT